MMRPPFHLIVIVVFGLIATTTAFPVPADTTPPKADDPLPDSSDLDLSIQSPPETTDNSCLLCRRYGKLLVDDTRHVLGAPLRWKRREWNRFAIGASVVVGSMALLDRPAADYIDQHHTDTKSNLADTFDPFGAEYAPVVLGGFYLAGRVTNDADTIAVARDGFASSLITSALIIPALKLSFGRDRPSAGSGPHNFAPFGGGSSFPSGHTAEAFTLAATIAEHYEAEWVDWTAYGIAGLVGYARMEHRAHFLSDVIAGALIGINVAKSVVGFNTASRQHARITPTVSQNGWGIGVTLTY